MVDKIVRLLADVGMTQSALERAAGLSGARISKWKNGRGEPTARNALAIARILGVAVEYLCDDTRDAPEPAETLSEAESTALKLIRTLDLDESEVIRRLAAEGHRLAPQTGGARRMDIEVAEGRTEGRASQPSIHPKLSGRIG